jgi:hypothetical protein
MKELLVSLVVNLLLLVLLCGGCAFDIAHVRYQPAQLSAQQDLDKFIIFKNDVSINDAGCYERILRKNTKWQMIGSIREGNVFKSLNQVLTLECSNVHEAYLVVLDNRLVGFYLPVEKGFVKLIDQILLPL